MRRLAQGQPRTKALRECGLPIGGAAGRILVENGRVAPKQLRVCGLGLRCATCSPIQWRVLGEKVDYFGGLHEAQGGAFAHSVLTIPHRAGDPLATILGWLGKSWQGMRNHGGFKAERARLDAVPVVALQVKWGPDHGWHPHYHVLWFVNDQPLDGFGNAVAEAWAKQTAMRAGRRASEVVGGDVVQNRLGFWEYLSRENNRHPLRDCLHPDHPGCPACRPGGEFDGKPVDPTPGPLYVPTPGPRYPTRSPRPVVPPRQPRQPRRWEPRTPRPARSGFDIFTELGSAAVRDIDIACAVLGDYIAGTAGVGRVRRIGHLSARFGSPPDVEPRSYQTGGDRLWLSGEVVAAVDLANRGTGSPLQAIGGAEETAAIWSDLTGRTIIVKPADDDGAPTLQFA